MMKNNSKYGYLNPLETIGKIKGKAKIYLITWAVFLVIAGGFFLASKFTDITAPSLLSVAQSSPLSFDSMTKSAGGDSNSASSPFEGAVVKFAITAANWISLPLLIIGVISYVMSKDPKVLFMTAFFLLGGRIIPLMSDYEDNGEEVQNSYDGSHFETHIIKGDVKGYLDAVGKYSPRAESIISNALESSKVNRDDIDNLKDVFSNSDVQMISAGLAETMAIALENKDDSSYVNNLPTAAALSAYIISSVDYSSRSPAIDSRTGYAIFETASRVENFDVKNPFYEPVMTEIQSQKKLRFFLNNLSAVSLGFCLVFFCLWSFCFRNVCRAEKMLMEDAVLSDLVK